MTAVVKEPALKAQVPDASNTHTLSGELMAAPGVGEDRSVGILSVCPGSDSRKTACIQ